MCINLVAKKNEPARPQNSTDDSSGAARRVGNETGSEPASAAAGIGPNP